MKKKIIASIVVAAIVVATLGYYEYSSYENAVLDTTVISGKITGIEASGPGGAGAPAPGLGGAAAGAPAGGAKTSSAGGVSFITISVPSGSFTQELGCGTLPYFSGQTVQVADQTLRSGQHQYSPDIACKGDVSSFKSLHLTSTTTSST
jgi:hypothetical protein